MVIREKELKLLLNFMKGDLEEARETEEEDKKNEKLDEVLGYIQQYLED